MVVSDAIHNIMGGIENTGDVRLHNHRRKLKQRFDIVKKLGQGTYGKVQLGINKETGQEVAIKTIRKCKIETEADLIRIRREIQIMSSVRHPNIIHIYEVFENREKMVLVMEYAAGGELYDYLSERKVLSEDEARRIFRQIATAIYYCHKHNICHRDLKLENILLDEVGNAKIADFGLSNVFSYSSLLSTFCGSPLYASPEIVKGTPYHGPEVDCWSLGVLLYTLVYGAMPFDGSNFKRLVKQISTGNYFEPKYPSPASPLIAEMLSVNPARRADISAICSHCWINETYSETCLEVAEELARQTPVRLDLLLSLTAPLVTPENIVTSIQVPNNEDVNGTLSRPIRSQSLGSIPPAAVVAPNVLPFTLPEAKESVIPEDRKPKIKKKERSHSRTRRKERSRSRPRKSVDGESFEQDEEKLVQDQVLRNTQQTTTSLLNSDTQIIVKPVEQKSNDAESRSLPTELCETKESFENDSKSKSKPVERRRSKVFEAAEKFSAANEKSVGKVPPPKKIILPGISIDGAKKEFERRTSLVGSNESNSPPNKNCISDTNPPEDELFPLASTVALNKLVESAFRDEPLVDKLLVPVELDNLVEGNLMKVTPKVNNSEVHNSKAATLPRRKTCTAEIQLVTPQLPPDNYKTEVEHFINKPPVSHKTEIVIPIAAPLPPKSLTKQDNQSKEHIIPIHLEQETPRKGTSPSSSWSASKSSIPRTSSSSLSRQSTVDSDSGSTISTGEPIRKSPREVIIPIAVEGGGYVTPREDTLTRISSVNDSEDESKSGSRCFTLRSTKRRQPEQNQAAQVDNADSLSSDEDDNFQLLTAENLFSTLLSRVRSLTQRLNNDDMRRSSAFPRSLFQHCKIFDNVPSRRLTETRSFSRPESAPWRRGITSNSQPERENIVTVHVPTVLEDRQVE